MIAGVVVLAAAASGCGDSASDSSSAQGQASDTSGAAAIKEEVADLRAEMKSATELIGACEEVFRAAGPSTDWSDAVAEADTSKVTEEQREAMGEYSQGEECITSNVAEMKKMSSEILTLVNELESFGPSAAEGAGNLVGP